MAIAETQQQYEGAILSQLIKNAERQAVADQDIRQLKADVAELKADVAELKADVAELKADAAELKARVTVLEADVASLKQDMAEIKPKIENIDATLGWIKWLSGAIAVGVLANLFSQPILSIFGFQ